MVEFEERRDPFPPTIITGYESWVGSYYELETERYIGFDGFGLIPFSKIILMAEHLGLGHHEKQVYHRVIRDIEIAVKSYSIQPKRPDLTPEAFDGLFGDSEED